MENIIRHKRHERHYNHISSPIGNKLNIGVLDVSRVLKIRSSH